MIFLENCRSYHNMINNHIVILFFSFFFLALIFSCLNKFNKFGFILSILSLTIFSVVRTNVDVKDYYNYFIDFSSDSINFEYGFYLIKYLSKSIGFSFTQYMTLIFLFYISCTIYFIRIASKKYSVNYSLFFILYCSYLLYLHGFVQVRIGLALSIIYLLMFNKYFVQISSILISSLIHKSSVVFFVCHYIKVIFCRFQSRSLYIMMALCSVLLSIFINDFFNDFLNNFIFISSKISMYYIDNDNGSFSGFGGKQILIIAFLSYFVFSKVSKDIPDGNIQCFNVLYISFCFFIAFSSSPSISYRVFEIFEIFFIISLCSVVKVRPKLGLCFCFIYIFLSIRAVFFIDSPLIKVLT